MRFFVVGLLLIMFIGVTSAYACDVRLVTACQTSPMDNIVMKLSDISNAHGEIYSESNYDYALCCDFTGSYNCGTNKVLGLSGTSNAHAEAPGESTYTTNVCYDALECTDLGSCNAEYPIEMLSLSDTVDAHLAQFNDYNVKICCKLEPNLYWADEAEYTITTPQGWPTLPHTYKMIVENSGLPEGPADFEVYEDDGLIGDDNIRVGPKTISGTVDANGRAVATWEVTYADLSSASGPVDEERDEENTEFEFYFKVGTGESNFLLFTYELGLCDAITECGDYTQAMCVPDLCEKSGTGTTCQKDFCTCEWDASCEQVGHDFPNPDNNLCVRCIDNVLGDWSDMLGGITNEYCDTSSSCLGAGGTPLSNSVSCTTD